MSRGRRLAASAAFFAILISWSLLLCPLGWLIWLARAVSGGRVPRSLARKASWLYGRSALRMVSPIVRVRCANPDEGLKRQPCLFVCNHQSVLDLYLLSVQSVPQICPVTKSWPFRRLVLFTACMRAAGYVEAEGRSVEEIRQACLDRVAEGASLMFYPEGSRSRTGELGRFHTGAFRLALDLNLPLVPMVVKNSGRLLPPDSLLLTPGTLELELLPAVMPEEYERFRRELVPHRALMRHVRSLYEEKLRPFAPRPQAAGRAADK
ncbi:MAG: lysophospholipid acyltransferase family protein [Desulfovibrionaceae bacterium]|nr:lysophospholipid acyltransferase family protein [Desulfovibrionaceae bacterium]